MFLKFVRQKNKTYVYIMEYLAVEKREGNNYKDREVVKGLGDVTNALIHFEIWKRYPEEMPLKVRESVSKEDLKNWVNSVMSQNHIYNMRV